MVARVPVDASRRALRPRRSVPRRGAAKKQLKDVGASGACESGAALNVTESALPAVDSAPVASMPEAQVENTAESRDFKIVELQKEEVTTLVENTLCKNSGSRDGAKGESIGTSAPPANQSKASVGVSSGPASEAAATPGASAKRAMVVETGSESSAKRADTSAKAMHAHTLSQSCCAAGSQDLGSKLATLRTIYEAEGQGHVFAHIDKLSAEEMEAFLKQLSAVDVHGVLAAFDAAVARKDATLGDSSGADVLPPAPESVVVASESAELFRAEGLRLIASGRVAVVTLAGGQGTRLGSSQPKGCYDIGLPSGKSLFQLQAERLIRLAKISGAPQQLLWFVMTSPATHSATEEYFEGHAFFGYDRARVVFFQQGVLPAIGEDRKLILSSAGSLALSPDGNGGIYGAMARGGVLERLRAEGVSHVHMYCVDNALVRPADPVFVGASSLRSSDCAAKTIPKVEPGESVGLFVRRASDGRMVVREYSELSPSLAAARTSSEPDAPLLLREANIANHLMTLPFLERVCADPLSLLPLHLAHKRIPAVGADGRTPADPAPMGYKLEAFIFDVMEAAAHPLLVQGARAAEFAPLKNAPGAARDGPAQCRAAVLAQHAAWRAADPSLPAAEGEVSPLDSYAGER